MKMDIEALAREAGVHMGPRPLNGNAARGYSDFAHAVEAAACAERDARIEHLERVLVQAREALHSCVPGDYSTGHVMYPSFDNDAVDASIEAIDEVLEIPIANPPRSAQQ